MKKSRLLFAIIFALVLCSCGKGNDVNPVQEQTPENVITDTQETVKEEKPEPEDVREEITYTSGVSISNNAMYDAKRREFDFNTKLGDFDGFEVWSEGTMTYIHNIEGNIIVMLLVKNTSDKTMSFTIKDIGIDDTYGGWKDYITDMEVLWHPNGAANYVLAPGEEKTVEYDFANAYAPIEGDRTADFNFPAVFGLLDDKGNYKEVSVEVSESLCHLSKDTLFSDAYYNAVVEGRILDENGNPVEGADVEVINPFIEILDRKYTDADGRFSITTVAAKNTFAEAWREMCLAVNKEGYNKRYIPVYPKTNQTLTAEVTIYPMDQPNIYNEVAVVDTGLQAYEFDTDNKSIISFVPFHSGYDPAKIADKVNLTTTDFEGNVIYSYRLPQETPFVDVSDDGKYTVVPLSDLGGGFKVSILDNSGKEVYSTHDLPVVDKPFAPSADDIKRGVSRCAQLSHDNKYLMASGADGDIWLIDWKKDEVIFSDWLMGQVREIKFSNDNSKVIASSGGGVLRAYDMSGNILWEADTQTWATKMEVTEKYVVLVTKCAGKNLLVYDINSGNLVWEYATMQNNMSLSVSPDEKYVWYGAHSSSSFSKIGCSIFELDTGKLVGMLNDQNNLIGAFSPDGSKIVTRDHNNIYVYNAKSGALLWTKWYSVGDFTMNASGCFNEDGTRFAVAMSEKYSNGGYGEVHFYEFAGLESTEKTDDIFMAKVHVKINPEVDLWIDENGTIIDVDTNNPDGRRVLNQLTIDEISLIGKSLTEGIEIFVGTSIAEGFLNDGGKVTVEVDEIRIQYEDRVKDILDDADKGVTKACKDSGIGATYDADPTNYHVRDDRHDNSDDHHDGGHDNSDDHHDGGEPSGDGDRECDLCFGTGIENGKCGRCDGDGILEAEDIEQICGTCHGKKQRLVVAGDGSSSYYATCDTCKGKGVTYHHDDARECDECHGTGTSEGTCHRCNGTGRM